MYIYVHAVIPKEYGFQYIYENEGSKVCIDVPSRTLFCYLDTCIYVF